MKKRWFVVLGIALFVVSLGSFALCKGSGKKQKAEPAEEPKRDSAPVDPPADLPADPPVSAREQADAMFWLTGILGLALIAAPFVMAYSGTTPALWTSVIVGVAVALISGIKALIEDVVDWEYWIAGVLGLVAVVSPFVFQFRGLTPAFWSNLILGMAVALFAGYKIFADNQQRVQA